LAVLLVVAALVRPIERLEDPRELFRRYARTAIEDLHGHFIALDVEPHFHRLGRIAVDECVTEDVFDGAFQARRVAVQQHFPPAE
jgi:hypothetical protein